MQQRPSGNRKWITPVLTGLFAVLVFVAWKFSSLPGMESSDPARAIRNNVYYGPLNSIAVLPFEAYDASADQEFWAAGFSSELTRLLTLAPGLQVTSRNSALYFDGRPDPARAVAERLQVNYLLSGSLRFSGDQVNLDLRLYSARRDEEAWSQQLDLGIGQLYGIQQSLLEGVTGAMRKKKAIDAIRIEPAAPDAWADYLRGRFHQESRTPEGFRQAQIALSAALAAQPDYTPARLALVAVLLALAGTGDPAPNLLDDARTELQAILREHPGRPEALGLSSYLSRNIDWNWQAAADAGEQAVRLNPGDPELMGIAGLALFSVGQFPRAGELMEQAARQDPLNLAARLRLGLLQEFADDYDAALASYRQILGMNPDFPAVRALRARVKLIQQKPEAAMQESELEPHPFWRRYSEILVLIAGDQPGKADVLIQQMMMEDGSNAAYQLAEIHAFKGDLDGAFDWLDRALRQRDGGMKELKGNYFLENLHPDDRWRELLESMKLPLDLDT